MEINKITNTENNKIYIGKTSKNTNLRWRWHINSSRGTKNDTLITRAMRKYGIEKFNKEEIQELIETKFLPMVVLISIILSLKVLLKYQEKTFITHLQAKSLTINKINT